MVKTSKEWWHSKKKGVDRTKKKMSNSQKKRRRKYWEDKNRQSPKHKPKLINPNQQLCKKKNLCLRVISGKVNRSTG